MSDNEEVDVTAENFKFRELTRVPIGQFAQKPPWKGIRTNALAVANKFGATFIGVPTGIKVVSTSTLLKWKSGEELSKHEIAYIALKQQPTWIAISSDNLTVSVCCCSEEGIQLLYFDIRNIFNETKAIKTAFYQSFLSKSKDDFVTSLAWNPSEEFAHLLALSLSNGKLYVISVKDNCPNILKEDGSKNVCAVSWNVDGKHLLVGKGDGSLCQLNQITYDVEHSVSVANNVIDGEVRTCDVLWISDCEIASVFTQSGDDDTPKLVLAKLSEKSNFSNITWKDYDEPSSGFGETRPTQLYLELIKAWDMFVYVYSNSSNVTILAKNRTKGAWEIWCLEDSCRAALPLSKYNEDEAAAIGVSVITGHEGSHPVLAIMTDDCMLCLFEMVNSMDGHPNIVHQVGVPDLKDERVGVNPQDSKDDPVTNQPPATTFQKQKLTAKPSIFGGLKSLGASQGFSQIPVPIQDSKASSLSITPKPSSTFPSSSPLVSKPPASEPDNKSSLFSITPKTSSMFSSTSTFGPKPLEPQPDNKPSPFLVSSKPSSTFLSPSPIPSKPAPSQSDNVTAPFSLTSKTSTLSSSSLFGSKSLGQQPDNSKASPFSMSSKPSLTFSSSSPFGSKSLEQQPDNSKASPFMMSSKPSLTFSSPSPLLTKPATSQPENKSSPFSITSKTSSPFSSMSSFTSKPPQPDNKMASFSMGSKPAPFSSLGSLASNPPASKPSLPFMAKTQDGQPAKKVLQQPNVLFPGSSTAAIGTSVADTKFKPPLQEPPKSKIPALTRLRESLKSRQQPDMKTTIREVAEFDEELQQFRLSTEDSTKTLESILESSKMPPELQALQQFRREIRATTVDLGSEIGDLSTETLSLLSDAKQVTQKKVLTSDRFYKEMMYNRPLTQSQRKKYSDLQNRYRYVVTASHEANALLDYKWQNDQGGGSARRHRRGKAREWDVARQALVSNMKVFHDLQVRILCLEQQIDRLRVSSKIAFSETISAMTPRSKISERSLHSVSRKDDSDIFNVSGREAGRVKAASDKKLSLAKQNKLGKLLAQRDTKKVVRADLSRTSILRTMTKTKEPSTTASSESEFVNGDTTGPSTETEGQEYSETDESSDESETFVKSVSEAASMSMMAQGSATLAYGAPNLLGQFHKPLGKTFTLAANEESKMNLNHPPQVVNIQTVSKPIYKGPSLLGKFEPKPEVPAGAVEVLQSVLETVKAERKQPVPEDWKFMSKDNVDGAGGDVREPGTISGFQMKPLSKASPFLPPSKNVSSPSPANVFSTPLIKTAQQSQEGFFMKPLAKEPPATSSSTTQESIFKLQTPTTKSMFNMAASASTSNGGANLFSGAPLFSSTPAVFGEASGPPIFPMERKTLFAPPSPVPTTASEVTSTPSGPTSLKGSSIFSIPASVPITAASLPSTPVPTSSPTPESEPVQDPGTSHVATPTPATPPVSKPILSAQLAAVSAPVSAPSPVLATTSGVASSVPQGMPQSEGTQNQDPVVPAVTKVPTPVTDTHAAEQSEAPVFSAFSVSATTTTFVPTSESASVVTAPTATSVAPFSGLFSSNAPTPPPPSVATSEPVVSAPVTSSAAPFAGLFSSNAPTPPPQPALETESSGTALSSSANETETSKPKSVFGDAASGSTFSSNGFGGFGGLSVGEKPVAGPPKNPFQSPFGASSTSDQPASQSSIFGQTSQTFIASSPFGSAPNPSESTSQSNPFGAPASQSPFSSFASPSNSGVGAQGFGGFNKPSGGGFGGAAKFGGTPSFGSSSPFGSTSRTFGAGFGSSTFGTTAVSDQNKGFASFGSGGTSAGFGTLASQGGSNVFGSFGNQGGSTFGSVANQSNQSGFGVLASQGNPNAGGSAFGSMANQGNPPAFGAQGNTNVFGSMSGNQGNSTGFGNLTSQGTGSAFGGNQGSSSGFGGLANNQSGSAGFGGFGSQSGSTFGGFGGMQSNQSGGFGMKSDETPAFTGWR